MTGAKLSVLYLLEDTTLFGGVKVPLHHANLLVERGYHVVVASKGEAPDWYDLHAEFRHVPSFAPEHLRPADVTIATFWTTIAPALAAPGACVHYCQGFEASYTHNAAEHAAILSAYALRVPCLAVSPHLADLVENRFGRPARVVPPALEPFWRPALRWRPHRLARIAVTQPFEIDWKGVHAALAAVKVVRASGTECRLVRISQWPLSEAERAVLTADVFHHRLRPPAVADVLKRCDLLLAPSWEQEGFGLPVLEAMACGVPVVASDIASFRSMAAGAAVLVPHDRPEMFAEAAKTLLADPREWRQRRRAGLGRSRNYREDRVADVLEDALAWAVAQRGGHAA